MFHIRQSHIRQVRTNNRHSIVVFSYLMPIFYLLGVAIGIQLEAATHIATRSLHVLVDNDDLCIVVLSQHITEIVVGRRERIAKNDYLTCTQYHLRSMIPCVYIMFGYDRTQLHRWQK